MVYDGWGAEGCNTAARFDSITSCHRQLAKKTKAAFIAKAALGFYLRFGFRTVLTGFRTVLGTVA